MGFVAEPLPTLSCRGQPAQRQLLLSLLLPLLLPLLWLWGD
jgi:hypothetical protein